MAIKLTDEYVTQKCIKYGFEKLEPYIKSSQPMLIKCLKCGYEYKKKWNYIQQNKGCINCAGNLHHNDKEVDIIFKKNNYIKLSEYKNSRTPIKCKCPNNHICNISFDNFYNKGKRCAECQGLKKYTLEEVKKIFNKKNLELLDNEYISNNNKLRYKCNICEYIGDSSLSSIKISKYGCKQCANNSLKHSQEYIENYYIENGCKLVKGQVYKNSSQRLKYICKCGNISRSSFNEFQSGHRCPKCGTNKTVKKLKHSQQYVEKIFKENGCKLIDVYINTETPIKYICECGNESYTYFKAFQKGHRCKKCGIKKTSDKTRGKNHYKWNDNREYVELRDLIYTKCKAMLRKCLKTTNQTKTSKTEDILGYSKKELLEHIQSHPNFENIKDSNWHLDHIIPVKAFVEHGITDLKIINHLSNLQPLSEFDNLSKGASYLEEDYLNYMKQFNGE